MRRLSQLAAVIAAALPLAAAAQSITLSPNTVSGTIGFANTDGTVLAELPASSPGRANIQLYSTAPSNNYNAQTNGFFEGTLGANYSLQAESSGGVGQVTYQAQEILYYGYGASYVFMPPQTVVLEPQAQMPDGATLDFAPLVTIHHIMFGTDSTCQTPVIFSSGTVSSTWSVARFENPSSFIDLIEPNGESVYADNSPTVDNGTITLTGGDDPYSNTETIQETLDLSPAGDAVVNHCIVFDTSGGGGSLALTELDTPLSFTGGFTVGQSPYLIQAVGPNGNSRYSHSDGSQGSLDFVNLVAGDWTVGLNLIVYQGGVESYVNPQSYTDVSEIPVSGGGTVDGSQMFGGVQQWPFAFDTALYNGSVLVYDAYAAQHPDAPSSLSSLLFAEQYDRAGQSIFGPIDSTNVTVQGQQGGESSSSLIGRYSPATGQLVSSYSIPVGLVYNQPESWPAAPFLNLSFSSLGVNDYGGNPQGYGFGVVPGDPGFRQGSLFLQPNSNPQTPMSPGDVRTNDVEYCTNEVVVQIQSTSGLLVNPSVSFYGSYSGTDFSGAPVWYDASGNFTGTPFVGYDNPSATYLANRASSGSISLPLPQGNWSLTASATFVDDSGNTSTGNFASTLLTNVGCGERISLVPGLTVSINPPDACDAPVDGQNGVTLSGTVNSSGAAIDHVWYTVGDGAPVDICASSGQSCPSAFSLFVPLPGDSNAITVYATSPFVAGTSSVGESIACNAGGCGASCALPPPSCTAIVSTPAEDVYGLVAYEDNWPQDGDLDFNDEALGYNYQFLLDASNEVTGFVATFIPLSMGANIDNGLYLHLPVAISASGTAQLSTGSGNPLPLMPLASLGTSGQLGDAVYALAPDFRALFGGASGFINTSGGAVKPGQPITLSVLFGAPIPQGPGGLDLGAAPFDLFLARTADKSHQIHFPSYDGSATGVDGTLFHTGDDGSNLDLSGAGFADNVGRWFVNQDGLPFALAVPQLADWPAETTPISQLYPEIVTFASTAGGSDADWYGDEQSSYAWQAGLSAPPPPPAEPAAPTTVIYFSTVTVCSEAAAGD